MPSSPTRRSQEADRAPTSGHPPHAERPIAASHSSRPRRDRTRRWTRLAAVLAVAGLGLGLSGCGTPSGSGAPPDVANAIQSAFGDLGPGVVSCMTNVAYRESRFDPKARNGSGASGLFQIMLPLHNDLFYAVGADPSWWWDAATNARAARALYNGAGLRPWGSC